MADELKIGAYICKGCGLGERLETVQLAQVAEREGKAGIVREHDYLCSADGVAQINSDIESNGVTHVVIAACSRRSKVDAFNFDKVALARANLREGVIWVRPDTEETRETTQEMAADYVRMGCAEVRYMQAPKGNPDAGGNRRILVVGGGASGMTAAIEAAKTGYEVLLVEKNAALGGMAAKLHKRVPFREPYAEPQDSGITELIRAIDEDKNINVLLHATISRTSGAPGQFSVDISKESGGTQTENIGAIVMATGFTNFDASQLPELGYGKSADVIDQLELEQLAKAAESGPIKRLSDGKEVRSVTFVQCAGQRSDKPGHLPYCSGHCCSTSVKQAMYFKERNHEIDTNVIYTDLRMPGNAEDFYRSAQRKGVIFTKGVVSQVVLANGELEVRFKDLILDEAVAARSDLVVLATGQVPNSGADIEALTPAEGGGNGSAEAGQGGMAGGAVTVPVASILNLQYRQGSDIPHLRHGFNDSHFICFPYETRRSGIYSCGPVRRPMDMVQAMEDATGAALKAIQAVENASRGRAASPRAGDLSFPTYRREGCTQCKRCTVECPFGAIDEDEQRYPVFNESRCRRCGTCMGACPVRVIYFENYSIDTVGAQLKAVDMPDEFDEKPRILILACENDAYPALDMAAMRRLEYSAFARVIPVRCLGSVSSIWVTDALNSGYDGVMLMGCKHGDDYQCHFVKGSELANERMGKIDDTLKTLNLEPERVCTYEVAITDIQRVPQLIDAYAAKIDEIGMNPFKGF
jgi:quinone-modifying oxidoreductase subunit QmoB